MTDETQPLILPSGPPGEAGFRISSRLLLHTGALFLCTRPHRNRRQPYRSPGRACSGRRRQPGYRRRCEAKSLPADPRSVRRLPLICDSCPDHLQPIPDEANSAAALIRGVVSRFVQWGCPVEGFDAYITSTVLPGSGLASSAAFEVLLGTILNNLFFDGKCTGLDIAAAGQYAEHTFLRKPCGLMDQLTSAAGNLVAINLTEPDQPVLHPVSFDFSSCGHALCMVDSRASHAGLTSEYAAIPQEMKILSGYFDKELLSQVAESEFYAAIPALRSLAGDRAVLRAIHFYQEDKRVPEQVAALEAGDFDKFLRLVRLSGYSSYMYLQNVIQPAPWRIRSWA